METLNLTFTSFLLRELNKRQKKNPAYSLRAFSRDLDIASSRLSEIINGKAGISEQRALHLSEKLNLSSSEKEIFVNLALAKHSRSALGKKLAEQKVSQYLIDFKNGLKDEEHALLEDLQTSKQPIERRDTSSMVFALNKDQVPVAKERLQQFRRELMKEFEATESKDSAYCMAVQFFEITEDDTGNDTEAP